MTITMVMIFFIVFFLGFLIGKHTGRSLGYREGCAATPLILRQQSLEQGRCVLCKEDQAGQQALFTAEKMLHESGGSR